MTNQIKFAAIAAGLALLAQSCAKEADATPSAEDEAPVAVAALAEAVSEVAEAAGEATAEVVEEVKEEAAAAAETVEEAVEAAAETVEEVKEEAEPAVEEAVAAAAAAVAEAIAPAAPGTIRMITEATFPPYEFRQGTDVVGIDVEICKAIAKELGKTLAVEDVEFDSVIPSLIAGKAEVAAAGITVTEDRKMKVDFSHPYVRTGIVFVFAKDKPFDAEKAEEAKGKRVGVQNGTTSADYVREKLGQEPEMFDSPASAFAAMKAGKVDVVIADIDPAKAVIKGEPDYDVSELLTVEEYAVAIKKGQPELLAVVNKVIDDLDASGKLDEIKDEWTAKADAAAAAEEAKPAEAAKAPCACEDCKTPDCDKAACGCAK